MRVPFPAARTATASMLGRGIGGRNLPGLPLKKRFGGSAADQAAARVANEVMGPCSGAVHWIEHSAQPLVVAQRFQHQQTSIKNDLEGPGIEAGECEGHGQAWVVDGFTVASACSSFVVQGPAPV